MEEMEKNYFKECDEIDKVLKPEKKEIHLDSTDISFKSERTIKDLSISELSKMLPGNRRERRLRAKKIKRGLFR